MTDYVIAHKVYMIKESNCVSPI